MVMGVTGREGGREDNTTTGKLIKRWFQLFFGQKELQVFFEIHARYRSFRGIWGSKTALKRVDATVCIYIYRDYNSRRQDEKILATESFCMALSFLGLSLDLQMGFSY